MARIIAVWLQYEKADGTTFFIASDFSEENGWKDHVIEVLKQEGLIR